MGANDMCDADEDNVIDLIPHGCWPCARYLEEYCEAAYCVECADAWMDNGGCDGFFTETLEDWLTYFPTDSGKDCASCVEEDFGEYVFEMCDKEDSCKTECVDKLVT